MTFEDWAKFVLQSNVVAAVVVGLFGVLTLKLGIGKFASEKWWERRAAAYAAVIEGLHGVHAFHAKFVDSLEKRYELSERYLSHLDEKSTSGLDEIRKGANIGSFVMSKRAGLILKGALEKLDGVSFTQNDPLSYHETKAAILDDAIIAMTLEAKRDLGT
jgi:hypothetical protein